MSYPIHKPKVRVFTWIILGVNLLVLLLLVLQISNVGRTANNCGNLPQDTCNAAKNIGTTIGAGLIIGLWVALDVILGVLWLVTRKRQPPVVYINQIVPAASTRAAPPAVLTYQSATAPGMPERAPMAERQELPELPSRATAISGGLYSGTGPGSAEVLVIKDQYLTFTSGGTGGRTMLIADGHVLVDVVGAQTVHRVVRATGRRLRFDVDSDGTWTIYLRRATRREAKGV